MELVQIPVHGRTIEARWYRAFADQIRPMVLLLPDMLGVTDAHLDCAQRLSQLGFQVLLPDLYSGIGAKKYCMKMLFSAVCRNNEPEAAPLQEIHLIVDYAKSLPNVKVGGIGIIGMCLTGGFALQMALRDDVTAPVVFHHAFGRSGSGLPPACAAKIDKTVQGHFVHYDAYCPKSRVDQLKAQLGDRLEVNYYRWLPHGIPHFFKITPEGRRAWDNMVRFLTDELLARPAKATDIQKTATAKRSGRPSAGR
jgi:carboxymethylenebutenolidase